MNLLIFQKKQNIKFYIYSTFLAIQQPENVKFFGIYLSR